MSDKCQVCNTKEHTTNECHLVYDVVSYHFPSPPFEEQQEHEQRVTIERARALRKVREHTARHTTKAKEWAGMEEDNL